MSLSVTLTGMMAMIVSRARWPVISATTARVAPSEGEPVQAIGEIHRVARADDHERGDGDVPEPQVDLVREARQVEVGRLKRILQRQRRSDGQDHLEDEHPAGANAHPPPPPRPP